MLYTDRLENKSHKVNGQNHLSVLSKTLDESLLNDWDPNKEMEFLVN